jgi:hypothetical protein
MDECGISGAGVCEDEAEDKQRERAKKDVDPEPTG